MVHKGLAKILFTTSIAIVLILFIITASGQAEITKMYDLNSRIVTISQGGSKIVEIQLISNTDQCLVDCEAVIRIRPDVQLTLPSSSDKDYRWDFIKASPEQAGLRSYWFEIQKTVPETVTDYSDVCSPYDVSYENGTMETIANCTRTEAGSHTEYRTVYEPFNFWSERFESGEDYYIRLGGNTPHSARTTLTGCRRFTACR